MDYRPADLSRALPASPPPPRRIVSIWSTPGKLSAFATAGRGRASTSLPPRSCIARCAQISSRIDAESAHRAPATSTVTCRTAPSA